MKRIPLSQGLFAIVDDSDFKRVSEFKWCADRKETGVVYAKRRLVREDGSVTTQYMHRFLIPGAVCVDHINGDGLDNRRDNIRQSDKSLNGLNRTRPDRGNKSGTCGVSRHSSGVGWMVRIRFRGLRVAKYFIRKSDAAEFAIRERARMLAV